MAGHSKWANIKHRKAATDSKRAKVFTKIAKELTIAARGGGDPEMNPSLRLILSKARAANMPNKNIERSVKRGTGEIDGGELLELVYEGYALHGVGLVIEAVTDNKNRAVSDIRHCLNKNGGSMATNGSVSWQFQRKGVVLVPREQVKDEDDFFMIAAEAGAEDVSFDDPVEVVSELDDFQAVQEALQAAGFTYEEANLVYEPDNTITLDAKQAMQVMGMIEKLEELDDVQNVYSSLDINDDVMAAMMEAD